MRDLLDNVRFLIWSNEHGQWWRPAELGYTDNIFDAGEYPLERAVEICARANLQDLNEMIVPVSQRAHVKASWSPR
jgi:hypothetical protein